jgi:phenylalanyl-tRNA synthetase alpha chain
MSASSLSLDKLQLLILEQLDAAPITDTRELQLEDGVSKAGGSHSEQMAIKAALDSLVGKEMVNVTQKTIETLVLSAEGESMAEKGSHEFRVWQALDVEKTAPQLQAELGNDVAQVGQLNAFKKKWIKRQGAGFSRAVSPDILLHD